MGFQEKLLKKFLKQRNKVNAYDNQAKNMAFKCIDDFNTNLIYINYYHCVSKHFSGQLLAYTGFYVQ